MKKEAVRSIFSPAPFDFPKFKAISLEDREIIAGYARTFDLTSCEYSFANLYSWKNVHRRSWSLYRRRLLIRDDNRGDLFMPAGEPLLTGELVHLSNTLRHMGLSGNMALVPETFIQANPDLERHYEIEKIRDEADYIYAVEKLSSLRGKKLQKKKNLIAQFKRSWPDYALAPLAGNLASACRKLAQKLLVRRLEISRSIGEEHAALQQAFAAFHAVGFEGLVLLVAGKPVAFSIFSRLNSEMYDIHFEKADPEFKGAAQIINRETARLLAPRCTFINREQDLGIPGLRQAKRSYDPERIESPYKLTYRSSK